MVPRLSIILPLLTQRQCHMFPININLQQTNNPPTPTHTQKKIAPIVHSLVTFLPSIVFSAFHPLDVHLAKKISYDSISSYTSFFFIETFMDIKVPSKIPTKNFFRSHVSNFWLHCRMKGNHYEFV